MLEFILNIIILRKINSILLDVIFVNLIIRMKCLWQHYTSVFIVLLNNLQIKTDNIFSIYPLDKNIFKKLFLIYTKYNNNMYINSFSKFSYRNLILKVITFWSF